jgi:hypothetical protein
MAKFEDAAKSRAASSGVVAEFLQFLGQTKKWWLLPVVMILLAFGLLMVLSGTAAAPFIYTLF